MDQQRPEVALHEGRNYRSPFTKLLVLDYYDGPTDGVVLADEGSRSYRFQMLAGDGETHDVRIVRLAPLPPDGLAGLVEVYALYEPVRWPFWFLSWHEGLYEEDEPLLAQAGPVKWVVATDDLLGQILAAKPVTPE